MSGAIELSRINLAERIVTQRFGLVRFAAGYDMDQVDRLLDSIVEGLTDGTTREELDQLINRAEFSHTRWRSGYAAPDVDAFFVQLTEELRMLPSSPAL